MRHCTSAYEQTCSSVREKSVSFRWQSGTLTHLQSARQEQGRSLAQERSRSRAGYPDSVWLTGWFLALTDWAIHAGCVGVRDSPMYLQPVGPCVHIGTAPAQPVGSGESGWTEFQPSLLICSVTLASLSLNFLPIKLESSAWRWLWVRGSNRWSRESGKCLVIHHYLHFHHLQNSKASSKVSWHYRPPVSKAHRTGRPHRMRPPWGEGKPLWEQHLPGSLCIWWQWQLTLQPFVKLCLLKL